MASRAAVDAAQAAAVMVRVHGPDPKGRKMRKHAFFHTESGDTTLSASGFLSVKTAAMELGQKLPLPCTNQFRCATVPMSSLVVVTCASIVEPFLSQQPSGTSPTEARIFPKLIPGAEIDVLVDILDSRPADVDNHCQYWIPANLECVVDIPAAGAALQPLLDIHGGNVDGAWEVGWTLAPSEGSCQLHDLPGRAIVEDGISRLGLSGEVPSFSSGTMNGINVGSLSMAATRVALLTLSWEQMEAAAIFQDGVRLSHEDHKPSEAPFNSAVARCLERGDSILAVGSPFGTLSPLHFHNSLSAGVVSNFWPPTSKPAALLMVDVRCLPGMEGGAVFDERGALVGMLTRPLRQRNSSTEVQLVMTTAVLAPALHHAGVTLGVPCTQHAPRCDHDIGSASSFSRTGNSLEADSCRGVTGSLSPISESTSLAAPAIAHALQSVVLVTFGDGAWASGVIISKTGLILTNAHVLEPWRFGRLRSGHDQSIVAEMKWRGYQRIRVRLEYQKLRSWHDAEAVYVSQGPLDIALLQLKSPPPDIRPIVPEESCPPTGSAAIVIGHGIFGPRAELSPSVSVGVVARVVKAGRPVIRRGRHAENGESSAMYPAMLQTTAAVHPGGSGGAVVNSMGQLIGLVTSNARHSAGSVIPFLNFSVPCGALVPIFDFASEVGVELSSLAVLDKPDRSLSAVWALVPSTPPRPQTKPRHIPFPLDSSKIPTRLPALPQSQSKETRALPNGSRFARFIEERGGELSLWQQVQSENPPPISYSRESQTICTTSCSQQIWSRL